MRPERFPPDDPREWLNRARSNLVQAEVQHAHVYLEDLCFQAQQAAEKAVKAVFIARGIPFPYVHDLARLLTLLVEAGEEVPDAIREAGRLSRFAVEPRYPGLGQPVTDEEYRAFLEVARRAHAWAEARVARLVPKESQARGDSQ